MSTWDFSPLYEELTSIPLVIYVPGAEPGAYNGLTSAIDVMPTVLDYLNQDIPDWVEGNSLLPKVYDKASPGRDFTVTTVPFANPGDSVHSVDNFMRSLDVGLVTTISTEEWSLLYSGDEGRSELYNLVRDLAQTNNIIGENIDTA